MSAAAELLPDRSADDRIAATVLIIDDHPIVLRGTRTVLRDLGVERMMEARGIAEGYRAFLRHMPDIVILDLTFEGDDLGGLPLIQRIADTGRNTRILVFSMHNDAAIVSRALESGALSYVLKDAPSQELAKAFEKVLAGEAHLSHELAIQVAMLRAKGSSSSSKDLTSREQQILVLLGRGSSYDKIAATLGISYKTVINTCSTMRSKLGIKSFAELLRYAIQRDKKQAT